MHFQDTQHFKSNICDRPEKTGLIYTKYTYSYYGAYLFFCVSYPDSVFLRILCIYDELSIKILFFMMRYCVLKTEF